MEYGSKHGLALELDRASQPHHALNSDRIIAYSFLSGQKV